MESAASYQVLASAWFPARQKVVAELLGQSPAPGDREGLGHERERGLVRGALRGVRENVHLGVDRRRAELVLPEAAFDVSGDRVEGALDRRVPVWSGQRRRKRPSASGIRPRKRDGRRGEKQWDKPLQGFHYKSSRTWSLYGRGSGCPTAAFTFRSVKFCASAARSLRPN